MTQIFLQKVFNGGGGPEGGSLCYVTELIVVFFWTGSLSVNPACVLVYLAENHVPAGEKGTTNCLHRLKQWQLGVLMF